MNQHFFVHEKRLPDLPLQKVLSYLLNNNIANYNIQYHISFFQLHDKEPHTSQEQPNHQNQEMKQIFQMQDLTLHYEQNLILHFFYE